MPLSEREQFEMHLEVMHKLLARMAEVMGYRIADSIRDGEPLDLDLKGRFAYDFGVLTVRVTLTEPFDVELPEWEPVEA